MNIALMTNNYKPFIGGVPISIERLAKALETKGNQVTVFAPSYEEQEAEENVFRYASFTKKLAGGVVIPNPMDLRIEKQFAQGHYDVIHVHHPMLIGRTAVYLSHKYNIPLVFTYHTRYEQYLTYFKPIRLLEKRAEKGKGIFSGLERELLQRMQHQLTPWYLNTFMKHCDMVLTPTKGLQDYLMTACAVERELLAVLPTGLDETSFEADAQKIQAVRNTYQAQDRPLFLTVSRMSHEKNVEFLLKSVAILKHRYGQRFRFLLVGDGPNRAEYEELCRTLDIAEEVVFTGCLPNEELSALYAAADLFLFASKTETQGIVLLEAFAGATPVYALHATGVSDLVRDGINGRLVVEDQDAYTECLMEYLSGRVDREMLRHNAYQTALQYRQEAVAEKAQSLYNIACQNKQAKLLPQRAGVLRPL